ncbi:hypothetical protein A2Z23_03115 [Candidatus Curtissbacteria bacterium RBG_16_39_7]|uniref:methylated-DNA--[protein]-cysteine S-methyltransferase n=1 Tax=Candidatus Curtissbacteria bacterium RBG_16_39_7 TaxID=1797707 RepID=A0A1F5G498_9BACT|nr:MAG: hypothetical protein A2Z23_03115 [Candidatus Curtissbacteria bacterium RBG_16_39_7]
MKTGSISESFQKQVLEVVKKIPKGKVATYGQIAQILGKTKASRAVGQALKRNPTPIIVPCHRVISSDGNLGGYLGGPDKKMRLLISEGVEIQNSKIDLDRYGWRGA